MKKITSAALAALLFAGNPAVTLAEDAQTETTEDPAQEITEQPGTRRERGFRMETDNGEMMEGELPSEIPEGEAGIRQRRKPADGEMTPPTDGETGATPAKPEGELSEDGSMPEMRKGRGMGRGFLSKEDMEFIENNEEAKSIMDQIKELMQKLRDLINSQKDTDTVTSDSL
ncbi:MAG: hypothetical protein E7190_12375 [Erysipelotrichaceae bacterium]|nr:hypothetical protein [Erysipelotrichaceae bacterium]